MNCMHHRFLVLIVVVIHGFRFVLVDSRVHIAKMRKYERNIMVKIYDYNILVKNWENSNNIKIFDNFDK